MYPPQHDWTDVRSGSFGDLWAWMRLPTWRFRRQWWGGCSMGPSLDLTKWGRIRGVWTAREDTITDQKGTVYVHIKYDDNTFDRYPLACLYLYPPEGFLPYGFFSLSQ